MCQQICFTCQRVYITSHEIYIELASISLLETLRIDYGKRITRMYGQMREQSTDTLPLLAIITVIIVIIWQISRSDQYILAVASYKMSIILRSLLQYLFGQIYFRLLELRKRPYACTGLIILVKYFFKIILLDSLCNRDQTTCRQFRYRKIRFIRQ